MPPRLRAAAMARAEAAGCRASTFIGRERSSTVAAVLQSRHGRRQVTKPLGFIEQHGLWTDDQRRHAEELKLRIEKDDIRLVRVAWADPHGASRAKAVTVPAFIAALTTGYNINVATTTLDSANARTFASFTPRRRHGPRRDDRLAQPHHRARSRRPFACCRGRRASAGCCATNISTAACRFISRRGSCCAEQIKRLADTGWAAWSGSRSSGTCCASPTSTSTTSTPAFRACAAGRSGPSPAEPGFSYHSESNMDLMQPVLSALADAFEKIGLPLRSIENEWGPGQVECTFAARPALEAADHALLFRTATRQICRRMGYFATFMCRPALKGYYSSGWHLHQSLVDAKSGQQPVHAGARARDISRRSAATISAGCCSTRGPARRSRRRPSTATGASGRTRSRPTAPPGATTTAA